MTASLRWTHIAGLVVLGSAAMTAWIWSLRPEQTGDVSAHWVAPITGGANARDVRMRWALMAWLESSRSERDLIEWDSMFRRCGDPNYFSSSERYEMWIGDYVVASGAQTWKVVLEPRPTQLDAWITRADLPPPPPPPPPDWKGTWDPPPLPRPQTQFHTRPLADVRALRDALSEPALWLTQSAESCLDGRPALIAACIDGRFNVALHDCDGSEATTRLWKALRATYPSPPPAL